MRSVRKNKKQNVAFFLHFVVQKIVPSVLPPSLLSKQADGTQPTTPGRFAILAHVPVREVGGSCALKPLVVVDIMHRHMAALLGSRGRRSTERIQRSSSAMGDFGGRSRAVLGWEDDAVRLGFFHLLILALSAATTTISASGGAPTATMAIAANQNNAPSSQRRGLPARNPTGPGGAAVRRLAAAARHEPGHLQPDFVLGHAELIILSVGVEQVVVRYAAATVPPLPVTSAPRLPPRRLLVERALLGA